MFALQVVVHASAERARVLAQMTLEAVLSRVFADVFLHDARLIGRVQTEGTLQSVKLVRADHIMLDNFSLVHDLRSTHLAGDGRSQCLQ